MVRRVGLVEKRAETQNFEHRQEPHGGRATVKSGIMEPEYQLAVLPRQRPDDLGELLEQSKPQARSTRQQRVAQAAAFLGPSSAGPMVKSDKNVVSCPTCRTNPFRIGHTGQGYTLTKLWERAYIHNSHCHENSHSLHIHNLHSI